MYLFFHEYSHYLMKKNGWYKLLQDHTFSKEVENIINNYLGENATLNALELIADSYATKRTTGSIPNEIRSIIKDLKKLEKFKDIGDI